MKQGGANKHSGAIGPHGKIKFKSRFIAQPMAQSTSLRSE
jgi:hypothetical protein